MSSQDIGNINAFITMFKHRVVNNSTLDLQIAIETSSRCYHYNNFKSLLTIEKYLSIDIQLKYRIAIWKFRISNHRLNIELGRYNNVPKGNRICFFCQHSNYANIIDCKYHAFFKCVKYDIARQSYLFNFMYTELHNFYAFLSSQNAEIVKYVSIYIYHLMNAVNDI